ncbi:MAG: tetratricopeptide repeat protein [Planctomycetota bacterium]
MPRRFLIVLLTFLAIPGAGLFAQAPGASRESEYRKAIGTAWEGLATWCVKWKLRDEARAAAEQALDADPNNAKAKTVKETVGASEAKDEVRKEYQKKLEATKKTAAGHWKSIAAEWHAIPDIEAYDVFWGRALELDPKSILPAHEAEFKAAQAKQDWKRAARLLAQQEKALPADPARTKLCRELEARASAIEPLLRKASTHEMRYFLSLPPGWTPDKTWPVLVACEGTGCNFKDQCARFASFRKDVPVIIVTPCTFANTSGPKKEKHPWYTEELMNQWTKNFMDFDDPGIMAALADVKREWGGEEKFFISGYSGGGVICFWEIFLRPTQLRGAFPGGANYVGHPTPPGAGGRDLPIRAFQSQKDEYFASLTAAWADVEKALKKFKFTNFTRTVLPDAEHAGCHEAIFGEIDAILKK